MTTSSTITLTSSDPNPMVNLSNVTITGTGSYYLFIGGTGDVATLSGGNETVEAYMGNTTITTGGGGNTIEISGTGNVVNAGGGHNIITDTGSGNTLVMPDAGAGFDQIFAGVGSLSDAIDLRPLLVATSWNGSAGTLHDYFKVKMVGHGGSVALLARDTTTQAFHRVAVFADSGHQSLSSVLAHAIT